MIITAALEDWDLARRLADAIVEESKRQAFPLPDTMRIDGPPWVRVGMTIGREGCFYWLAFDPDLNEEQRYVRVIAARLVEGLASRVGEPE